MKAFARIRRLAFAPLDELLQTTLNTYIDQLGMHLQVSPSLTGAEELVAALKTSRTARFDAWRRTYTNQGLFSHDRVNLGNKWLAPNSALLKEGDKIKALRLRANLWPTRTLYNRAATDPAARRCQRCGKSDETSFHILQECVSVHDSRVRRHDFLRDQLARILRRRLPTATVDEERTMTSVAGTRLRPDIVLSLGGKTYILDLAVAWDASMNALEEVAKGKREKYSVLSQSFAAPTKVQGVVFGARSLVATSTKALFSELGIPESDLAWLSAKALVGSLITLNRFVKVVRP